MSFDKKKLYILSCVLAPAFLLVYFIGNALTRRLALVLVAGAVLACVLMLVKKQSALSINKKQVLWVLPLFAFLGIVLLYMSGTVLGFNRVIVTPYTLLYKALPFAAIITASEFARERLLMQNKRGVNILSLCAFILCEIAMLYESNPFENFTLFRNFFGTIAFPCIASGFLYQFISKRYGAPPVILYRLIVALYSSLLPIYPAIPISLLCFLKILFPILAIFFIGYLYERKKRSFSRKKSYIQTMLTALVIVLMSGVIMLVSCRFRYGLLVVASESMTGSIDKGDAIIYEEYTDQTIKDGQVIVFKIDQNVYIHRVVKVEYIDGELRYTTKGDANDENDADYVTEENIVGLSDVKIKYIGYPTLWIRQIFNGQ